MVRRGHWRAGSVLQVALLRHPAQAGGHGGLVPGVLELEQVAHLADGLQSLKGRQHNNNKKNPVSRRLLCWRKTKHMLC